MTFNCAIIDNDPAANDLLVSYVRQTPSLNLLGTFSSPLDAMKIIHEETIDVLFLEVNMKEMSGIEFAKILPSKVKVIFVTSDSKYAIDAFQVNAAGYLLKPLEYDGFAKTIEKLQNITNDSDQTENPDDFIFIKSDYKLIKLFYKDILYINGQKDYVKFYLANGTSFTSLMNMKNIDNYLPKPLFMRVHRSYIINTTKIDMIDKFRFVINNDYVPISETYKEDILSFINKHVIA